MGAALHANYAGNVEPPKEVLIDRERRWALPKQSMGDPPIGCSALDAKLAPSTVPDGPTIVYRVPVLSNGTQLARIRERRSYDPVTDTWSNNHLYRESITLVRV